MQKVQVCSIPTQFFPHTKHYQAPAIQFFKCLPFAHDFCNEHPSKCYIPESRLSQIPEESGTSELLGKQGMMAAALLLICFTANFLKNFSLGWTFTHCISWTLHLKTQTWRDLSLLAHSSCRMWFPFLAFHIFWIYNWGEGKEQHNTTASSHKDLLNTCNMQYMGTPVCPWEKVFIFQKYLL